MGRADYYDPSSYNAICDRCGFKYKANQLRKEWTGWMVCDSCWEPRHPQEFLRGRDEDENVQWTRPDTDDEVIEIVGDAGKRIVYGVNSTLQEWNTELTEDRVIRLEGTPQRGDRITIYKTAESDNKLIITSTLKDSGTTV